MMEAPRRVQLFVLYRVKRVNGLLYSGVGSYNMFNMWDRGKAQYSLKAL